MATTLHAWGTPNGYKPLILLEELGVPYDLVKVDIHAGEQKAPAYLQINPNGRIPALVDDGHEVWESGAILLYLAEKHARFLPTDPDARLSAISWLFWQMAGVGPMFGQLSHFKGLPEAQPYPLERYADECRRLLSVIESRVATSPFLAGEYSIADIATFPWARRAPALGIDLAAFPHTHRWIHAIGERPAVKTALAIRFP